MLRYLLVFVGVFLLGSCEKSVKNNEPDSGKLRDRITINLIQNVTSIAPSEIQNSSDKLLSEQIFETLLVHGSSLKPRVHLVEDFQLDTIGKRYDFKLRNDILFSDGSKLSTKNILNSFIEILQKENPTKVQEEFRNNILGYSEYNDLNSNESTANVPSGFQITDSSSFSITVTDLDYKLAEQLANIELGVFKRTQHGQAIGTGPFKIDFANEDISLSLSRNRYYWKKNSNSSIEGINVRFIKNEQAIIDEFKNGSIDVVEFSSLFDRDQRHKLLDEAYGYHNFVKQQSGSVFFMEFHNMDSMSIADRLQSEALNHYLAWKYYEIKKDQPFISITDSIEYLDIYQTSRMPIPCINKTDLDYTNLTKSLNVEFVQTLSNPNSEFLVIKKARYENDKLGENSIFNLIENDDNQNSTLTGLAILEKKHDLIMYNERIKGFTEYGNWAEDLSSLSFYEPLTF